MKSRLDGRLGLNGLLVLALVNFSTVAADINATALVVVEVCANKIHVINVRMSSNPCARTHRYIYRVQDIENRVKLAGGSIGKFSATLSWKRRRNKEYGDLDFHLFLPPKLVRNDPRRPRGDYGGDVCFKRKRNHHFELDVDMNGKDDSVENIVFPSPSLPKRKRRTIRVVPGEYSIVVENFAYYDIHGKRMVPGKGPAVPFEVLISVNDKKTLITGLCTKPNTKGRASAVGVARFTVGRNGKVTSMEKHKPMGEICGGQLLLSSNEKKERRLTGTDRKKKQNKKRRRRPRANRRWGEL